MTNNQKQNLPETIGGLRLCLAELGNPWEVDPQLSDDAPLPALSFDGQRENEVPEEDHLVSLEPSADIQELIAAQLPANPLLMLRWMEAGMLSQDEVTALAPQSSEGEIA